MAGRVSRMNELRQQQVKRKIRQSLNDIDQLKARLAVIRSCCAELAAAMRQIRTDAEQAKTEAEQRRQREQRKQQLKRVV